MGSLLLALSMLIKDPGHSLKYLAISPALQHEENDVTRTCCYENQSDFL